jgi:hypothetical protein
MVKMQLHYKEQKEVLNNIKDNLKNDIIYIPNKLVLFIANESSSFKFIFIFENIN